MSREILFRGKNVETKKWVYGFYNIYKMPIINIERPFIKDKEGYDCAIIPETIGQFCGLTDENGVKIFENDIVDLYFSEDYSDENHSFDAGERFNCVVKFKNGAFWCECKETGYDYIFDTDIIYQVIGNIHNGVNYE